MKFKKQVPYEILITPTVNDGFLVKCGCVVAAYANHNDLIMDLREYLEHPVEVEKQYKHDIGSLSTVHMGPGAAAFNTASGLTMLASRAAYEQEMMRQREEGERSHEI